MGENEKNSGELGKANRQRNWATVASHERIFQDYLKDLHSRKVFTQAAELLKKHRQDALARRMPKELDYGGEWKENDKAYNRSILEYRTLLATTVGVSLIDPGIALGTMSASLLSLVSAGENKFKKNKAESKQRQEELAKALVRDVIESVPLLKSRREAHLNERLNTLRFWSNFHKKMAEIAEEHLTKGR